MKSSTKKTKEMSLEEQYKQLFTYNNSLQYIDIEESSLEQPSPLVIVPSLTTYGAYEEPITGQ